MKVMFGYQDVLEVIKNGVTPRVECATGAQRTAHKKDKEEKNISKLCISFINVLILITLRRLVTAHPQRKLEKSWRKVM